MANVREKRCKFMQNLYRFVIFCGDCNYQGMRPLQVVPTVSTESDVEFCQLPVPGAIQKGKSSRGGNEAD